MSKRDCFWPTGIRLLILQLALVSALFSIVGCGRLQVATVTAQALPVVAPAAEMSRLIFVRPRSGGGDTAISIWEQDTLLAYLRGAQMMSIDMRSGHHVFLGVAGNADVLEADLLPGKTYVVHCRFNSYYMGSSVHLDPVYTGHENWVFVEEWLKNSSMTAIIPTEGDIWTSRNAEDNAERMTRYASRAEDKKKLILPEYGF